MDRQQQQHDAHIEAMALHEAIQASLHTHRDASSAALAQHMHLTEVAAADDELAQAVAQSQLEWQRESAERALTAVCNSAMAHRGNQEATHGNGSWDCPQCTFHNAPYRPKCQACEGSAPLHVLVFCPLPASTLQFGVEIELFLPNGARDGFTLASVAKQLTALGPPTVQFDGYTHTTSEYWKIVPDASLHGNHASADLAMELVSPILRGEDGLHSLRTLMEHVRRLGIATNDTCSFHVHVDATENNTSPIGNLRSLKRIAQCYVSLENALDLVVSKHSRRADSNRYCRSNRLAFHQQSHRQRFETLDACRSRRQLVECMNPHQCRYFKLNLTNLVHANRPSTIEFRHHGGVTDLTEAEAWVRLVLRFCYTCSQRSATELQQYTLLPQTATPQQELRALFHLLDDSGLEQFFTLERSLFAGTLGQLQNMWTCRTCRRTFGTSRSLGQHVADCGH